MARTSVAHEPRPHQLAKSARARIAVGSFVPDAQELGAFGQWMRDTVLTPFLAPMIGKALTRVYVGEPALVAMAA